MSCLQDSENKKFTKYYEFEEKRLDDTCDGEPSEDSMLEKLLLKLKLSIPAFQKESKLETTTVDIIEHAILYIRKLWKILEDDSIKKKDDPALIFSPTQRLNFSYLTVQ